MGNCTARYSARRFNLPNYQITHLLNLFPDLLGFPVQHCSDCEKRYHRQRQGPDADLAAGNADWNIVHSGPDQQP